MLHTTHLHKGSEYETILSVKKNPDKETIPNNIRQLRKGLGLSQPAFGALINASRQDVCRYEAGKHLTVRLLLDIKQKFGVSIDNILDTNKNAANLPKNNNQDDKDKKIMILEQAVKALSKSEIIRRNKIKQDVEYDKDTQHDTQD